MAADGVGKLQTYADIYGIDSKMAAALFGKSEALTSASAGPPGKQQKQSAWNGSGILPGLFGN
jgi:hypothetical protein